MCSKQVPATIKEKVQVVKYDFFFSLVLVVGIIGLQ